MMTIGILAGYLAVVFTVLIYQQNNRTSLLKLKTCADVLWIIHYFFMGAYTGAAVTGVALIRELVFYKDDRQNPKRTFILAIFLCAGIVCAIVTWQNAFSFFAMVGSLLSVFSFWLGKPHVSRLLAFPISICMLIYGISSRSGAVLINELLVMISSTLGLLRLDRKHFKNPGYKTRQSK